MITVLFVDDEQFLLDGLRRVLRPMRDRWNMQFVNSGPSALELMESEPVDAIVSDMRMPGMDGMELLEAVRSRYPHVARLVLSGQTDRQDHLLVSGATQELLHKPCDPELLSQAVERSVKLTRELARTEPVIEHVRPEALERVSRVMGAFDELSKADERNPAAYASALEADEELCADVIRLCDQILGVTEGPITDAAGAVETLGVFYVRDFTAAAGLLRASAVGDEADAVRQNRRLDELVKVGRFFLTGTRMDYTALSAIVLHEACGRIVAKSKNTDGHIAAARLLRDWGIRYDIVMAVAWGHVVEPERPWELCTLHLVHLTRIVYEQGEPGVAALPEGYLAALGRTVVMPEALELRNRLVHRD